jgi:hypothetical protein
MESYIKSAFEQVVSERSRNEFVTVSLYRIESFYGGPEEGGWWGSDWILEESATYFSKEIAESVAEKIKVRAEELSRSTKDSTYRHWALECNQAEARGEDPADLPEPDGPTRWSVVTEGYPGQHAFRGSRTYE